MATSGDFLLATDGDFFMAMDTTAYTNATAMGSQLQRSDPAWQALVDDVNAKDAAMKSICGGR